MDILDRVASLIRSHNLLVENDRIIVAVSGGADSMALLHLLAGIALPLELIAVYIDHGLRPQETPHEQEIIAAGCRSLDVIFMVRTVHVQKLVAEEKKSPEEAARILRYKALEEVRQQCNARHIAVGHTADDQVEEFFIRLLRGSSSRGLSGMRTKRERIVRPLLFENKAGLMTFLADRGLPWCLDSSNLDRRFLRNRIRLDLLPLLEQEFNPALRKTVGQHMDILAEEDNYLELQAASTYSRSVVVSEVSVQTKRRPQLMVNRQQILAAHPAIQRRVMEKSCWQMGIRPTYEQICTLVEFIINGKNGSELHLEDGVRAEKTPHSLCLTRPLPANLLRGSAPPAALIEQSIPGPGTYAIPGTGKELVVKEISAAVGPEKSPGELRLDPARISFPLLLRSFRAGEIFHPYGAPGRKKISRYFNERKIPAKERAGWPVLLSEDKIIALVGLQIDHNFRLLRFTGKVLSICWRDRKT